MCLLPEGPGADLADEGLLPRVDLEMLLKVEPLGVDEEAAHRTTLVVRPDRKGCCHMIAYSKRSRVSRLMNKNQRCGSGTYSWIRIRNKSFWICNTDKKKAKMERNSFGFGKFILCSGWIIVSTYQWSFM